MNKHDKALADLNKVIKINPRYPGAYCERAIAYYVKKDYERSWQDVHTSRALGFEVYPKFLKLLKKASKRKK